MSRLKTAMPVEELRKLVIWQGATAAGYWEEAADRDLQYMYLLGQLRATESLHSTQGNNATRLRIKLLKRELEVLKKGLLK